MDGGTPTLEVGFAIDTGASFLNVERLQEVMASAEARIVADAARIENATRGMVNLGGATAAITAWGNAETREAANAVRARNSVEKAGESLSRQLDRQASTFGKTAAEIRQMKVETAALAAEQAGLTELAGRLRSQEQALYDAEFAAMRRAAQVATDAAEAKQVAANQAIVAAEAEAQAVRSAALAYNLFEAAARQGMAALREQQAAEAAAAADFERLAGAAQRLRASIDPAVAAQQRFDREMSEARALISAGVISLDEYVGKLRMEQQALDQVNAGHAGGVKGTNALRYAMTGLSYQAQDTFTQLSMGGNVLQVFAIQGGQLAGQFANIEGRAGAVARFMLGGWGLAITAGALVLGPLISGLLHTNSALDEGVEKLKKDAEETGISRQAKELFTHTIEGLIAAIQEEKEANDKAGDSLKKATELAMEHARAKRDETQAYRDNNAAKLEALRIQLQDEVEAKRMQSQAPSQRGELGTLGLADAQARLAGIEAQIAKNAGAATAAEVEYQRSRVGVAVEMGKALATAEGRINKMYDDQVVALQNRADAIAKSGGKITSALTDQFTSIERNRQAALAAERDRQAALRATNNEIGRNIDLNEARKIAESVGGRVTSAGRSYDEQARLYQKYKSGTGSLAAKPGSSYHEIGQALDVAKSNGVTLKKLVDAYRKAGVKIVEALDEGDHFHIAWKKVGDAAKAQSEAETDAKRQKEHADTVEAQIVGLQTLASAYKLSGAAALLAAADERAALETIKNGGDMAAEQDRQVRLAIAERIKDAAQSTAALRNQTDAQRQSNAMVAAGLLPAGKAADFISDQLADLPLLDAIKAAQQRADEAAARGDVKAQAAMAAAAARATSELGEQRDARKKNNAEIERGQILASMEAGRNQLAMLAEENRLLGVDEETRARTLAIMRAQQEIKGMPDLDPFTAALYVKLQGDIAVATVRNQQAQDAYNDSLSFTADKWAEILNNVQDASSGLADAFGPAGQAIGDLTTRFAQFSADRARLDQEHAAQVKKYAGNQAAIDRENKKYALQAGAAQIDAYGDMLSAAKGFFNEKSRIYKALQTAEQVYRAVQIAMSIAAMFQDTAETVTHVANAGARATANAAEGVSAQAKLPFPANIAAMAATAAAVVAFGIAMLGGRGGGSHTVAPTSSEDLQKAAGTGTLLGSPNDKSASIAHSLDLVAKNTDGVLQYNSQMLSSLRSIDASIGAMAATVAKQINVAGSLYDTTKLNLGSSGSAGFLGLFSSSTQRSLYDAGITLAATTVGNIVANGISGQTYQIVEQVKKSSGFLGIGGGTKTSYQTTNGGLPSDISASIQSVIAALENGIVTAAGAIGIDGAKAMLDNFTVSIGQLSFNGLDAQGIEDQLNAVFSSVGDQMVAAILPGIVKFQKVGEGLFETLERVASTVGAVDTIMQKLGRTSTSMGIEVDMGIASMFDSVGDFTSAANAYFETYYSTAEQSAAKTAQLGKVFDSLNLAMPATLEQFRALVEAQDLTTAAGQATFATLLQLAPAFADLKQSMDGAKSAADITSERLDLQRQMLQLQGDTAALRALDLAKLDPSNRALQQQIYDLQDAQDAAKAAQTLADAWKSVGDSIMDEVKRIRGLSGAGDGSFASLMGQFNVATLAARGGDQDAAKSLPGLSQSMLNAAKLVATSRQELDRIQAQTAASLEETYAAITALSGSAATNSAATTPTASLLASAATAQAASTPTATNDDLVDEIRELRAEVVQLRTENNAGHAANAANTGKIRNTLDNVTQASGGDSVSVKFAL